MLTWTRNAPTVEGWYFVKTFTYSDESAHVVHIGRSLWGVLHIDKKEWTPDGGGLEWAGPIEMPAPAARGGA